MCRGISTDHHVFSTNCEGWQMQEDAHNLKLQAFLTRFCDK
jgi:hypothetical protein